MLDEGIFVFEDQEALCLNDYEQNKKKCVISHYHTVLYLFQMPPEEDVSKFLIVWSTFKDKSELKTDMVYLCVRRSYPTNQHSQLAQPCKFINGLFL